MIMGWILVLVFNNGYDGAVTTVGSYYTQTACENARLEVVELQGYKTTGGKQRLLEKTKCIHTGRK